MGYELSRLVDALPGLVWTTTADGATEFLNERWRQYTGSDRKRLGPKGWRSAIHPDDLPAAKACWKECLASGKAREIEARLRRFDGEYRWFQINSAPVTDDQGVVVGWCGINTDIEDRVQAEAAVREQKRRFERVVDGLPVIAALSDPDGKMIFCNRLMIEYRGETLEDIQAQPPLSAFHPDDRPGMLAARAEAMRTGQPMDREGRLRRHDGVYLWHRYMTFPLRDPAGEIEVWYCIVLETEGVKRAEAKLAAEKEALRISEAELRRSYELLSEGERLSRTSTFLWDVEPDVHNWSQEAYRIWEFPPGTKITMQLILSTLHPEDLPRAEALIGGAIAGAPGFDFHFRIRTASGALKHLRVVGRRAEEIPDRPVFIGALRDVTDSKLVEDALRESNRYLSEAQALSRTGSFTWDMTRDEHSWSDELYCIWQIDPGTKLTRDLVFATIHPEDLPEVEAVLRRTAEGGDFDISFRILTPSGEVRHLHTVAHRLAEIQDRVVYLGAAQNVTEAKLAEEALKASEDALNRARSDLAHAARVMALNTLTASIAHEVSQPLAGIITNTGTGLRMLDADPPNIDGARVTMSRALRDGNRASEVIRNLRGMFARKDPTIEPVDLNDAAREVLALSAAEMQRRRVALNMEFATDLPDVRGDRVQLQQVILNLVLNAADAMNTVDDRPRDLCVQTLLAPSGEVQLSVRDAGVGLDASAAERLFDAFYTTKSDGMGVGLAISRSIIEAHKGRLWAQPNDGPGATFSFSIPHRVSSHQPNSAQPSEAYGA
jgi:PAS domain S-box-containing protein